MNELKTLYDLLECVINTKISCRALLDQTIDSSKRGFLFEAMYKLYMACDYAMEYKLTFCHGNANLDNLQPVTDLIAYIKTTKIFSGSSTGYSDIHLTDQKDKSRNLFITCKYLDQVGNISLYDIDKVYLVTAKHGGRIGLCLKDKSSFYDMLERAKQSSEITVKNIDQDLVFDLSDLDKFFKRISLLSIEQIENQFKSNKPALCLNLHQRYIVHKLCQIFTHQKSDKGGLYVIPRGGKTFIFAKLILELKIKFCLIVTPVKKTINGIIKPYLQYTEFDRFKIFRPETGHELKNLTINPDVNNIVVVTKDLIDNYIKESKIDWLIESLKNNGLIIWDENHHGGVTEISMNVVETYKTAETKLIVATGTWDKSKWGHSLADKQCAYLNHEDIFLLKQGHILPEIKPHYDEMLAQGHSPKSILSFYKQWPTPIYLSMSIDNNKFMMVFGTVYGYSFRCLFKIENGQFVYEIDIILMIRHYFGSQQETDFPNGNNSIERRIYNSKRTSGSVVDTPIRIMFMPTIFGQTLIQTSTEFIKLLNRDRVAKNYKYVMCNSLDIKYNHADVESYLERMRLEAKAEGKIGLIVLTGSQLNMGITLPHCEATYKFHDISSGDVLMQQDARCFTPLAGKENVWIIDPKIDRIYATLAKFPIRNPITDVCEKIKYVLHYHLCSLDPDQYSVKELGENVIIDRYLKAVEKTAEFNIERLMFRLRNDYHVTLTADQQKIFDKLFKQLKDQKVSVQVRLDPDIENDIPTGIQRVTESDDPKKQTQHISITYDVLPRLINICSTIYNVCDIKAPKDITFLSAISIQNAQIKACFNFHTQLWWKLDIEPVVTLLSPILESYRASYLDQIISRVFIRAEMEFQKITLDDTEQIEELFTKYLPPNEDEKRAYGEVFTPFETIRKMFDLLPAETWSNPNIKILDPANGIGNFLVIAYQKLMVGLAEQIPDLQLRRQHIIKNQLYAIEIQPKNNLIFRKFFGPDCNLIEGDALTNNTWNTVRFDIVVGNPPYNTNLKKSGASPLYHKFVERYIDRATHLLFLIPSRWTAGGKGLDLFRKAMFVRTDIATMQTFQDATEIFGNKVDIKGGVQILHVDKNCTKPSITKYDIVIDDKFHQLIDKMMQYDSIATLYCSQSYFNIQTNDVRLTDNKNLVRCYVSQKNGLVKYIDPTNLTTPYNFWKVLTTDGAHSAQSGFGNMFICDNNSVYCKTYIAFRVNNEQEAKSLLTYLQSRLPNLLLSLRKNTQHVSGNTCKWIPLVPLDRIWTDELVYKYFNLSSDEIKLIQATEILNYSNKEPIQKPKIVTKFTKRQV
jgi:site-specific DNA-methyltransferase (adenine-specific)